MSERMFSRMRPSTTVLRPEDMSAWCEASLAYDTAIRNATVLLSATRNAYDAECRRGYQTGHDKASAEMARRLLATDEAVAKVLRDLETSLPAIVTDVVTDLFGRLDIGSALPAAIRHTLGKIRHGTLATLRVAPDCAEILRPVVEDLTVHNPGLRLEIDPMLASGRCVLESELGVAELGVDAQLAVLREHLSAQWMQHD